MLSKLKPSRRTPETIQAEIVEYQDTLPSAQHAFEELSARRPSMLLDGTDTELDAHDAEQRRRSIAVDRIVARIDVLRKELVAAEAAEAKTQCERQATAIEAAAKVADVAIDRIVKAAAEIDKARIELAAALTAEMVPAYAPPASGSHFGPHYLTTARIYDYRGDPMPDTLTPDEVAARVAGHLLAAVLPTLGIARIEDTMVRHADGQPTSVLAPITGPDAARALLTDRMRAAAAEVRRTPNLLVAA